uniref:Centromere protein N n=1 Tax=Felis catus TaxID=9685 RepID=A0ABI7WQY9_FELCA
MDETVAEFIKRTILKIPMTEMMTILKAWDFLPENQLQTVNFRQRKESLVQDLVLLCESKRASLRDAALLDIICFFSVFSSLRCLLPSSGGNRLWSLRTQAPGPDFS